MSNEISVKIEENNDFGISTVVVSGCVDGKKYYEAIKSSDQGWKFNFHLLQTQDLNLAKAIQSAIQMANEKVEKLGGV